MIPSSGGESCQLACTLPLGTGKPGQGLHPSPNTCLASVGRRSTSSGGRPLSGLPLSSRAGLGSRQRHPGRVECNQHGSTGRPDPRPDPPETPVGLGPNSLHACMQNSAGHTILPTGKLGVWGRAHYLTQGKFSVPPPGAEETLRPILAHVSHVADEFTMMDSSPCSLLGPPTHTGVRPPAPVTPEERHCSAVSAVGLPGLLSYAASPRPRC